MAAILSQPQCVNATTHIDGLVQERRNSIANALELHLSCTNPSIRGIFLSEMSYSFPCCFQAVTPPSWALVPSQPSRVWWRLQEWTCRISMSSRSEMNFPEFVTCMTYMMTNIMTYYDRLMLKNFFPNIFLVLNRDRWGLRSVSLMGCHMSITVPNLLATRLSVTQPIWANSKKKMKAVLHWAFVRGTTGDRCILLTNGQ